MLKDEIEALLERTWINRVARAIALSYGYQLHERYLFSKRLRLDPQRFAGVAVPFAPQPDVGVCRYIDSIDPWNVIGGRYIEYIHENDVATEAQLHALNARADDDNGAQYVKLGELPLYYALEGKNRVSMYRRLNYPIRGEILKVPYPEAESLTLHRILPFGLHVVSCSDPSFLISQSPAPVFRGKYLIVPHEASLKLLRTYGVREANPVVAPGGWRVWRATNQALTERICVG